MSGDTMPEAPMVSRTALLEAAAALGEDGPPDPTPGLATAWLEIVARADAHLLSTTVAPSELRRAEVWISPLGVVAIAHQDSDDVPAPLVALPPQEAYSLVGSTTSLSSDAVRGSGAVSVPDGMLALVDQVLGEATGSPRLVVLDWSIAGTSTRWILLDSSGGRVGTLDAPLRPDAELQLEPLAPMQVLVALSEHVSAAVDQPDR